MPAADAFEGLDLLQARGRFRAQATVLEIATSDLVFVLQQAALLETHLALQLRLQVAVALVVGQRVCLLAQRFLAGRSRPVQQGEVALIAVVLDQRQGALVVGECFFMLALAGQRPPGDQQQHVVVVVIAFRVEVRTGRRQRGQCVVVLAE